MHRSIFAVVTGVLVCVGCGSAATEQRPTPRKPDAPSPELSSPAATNGEDAPSCPVTGTWEGRILGGPFAGQTIRFVIDRDRAVRGVAGPSPVNQSWSLYGDVLSVQNRSDSPHTGACSPEVSATYDLDFDETCTRMRLVSIEDPCTERRRTMEWLELDLQ